MGRRRVWMIVLGIIALVLCIPLIIGGVAFAVLFGPDGRFSTDDERINTDTRALVSAVAEISSGAPVDRDWGVRLELNLQSASDKPLFVGIGPADDVGTYLQGVDAERIDDFEFSPFRYAKTPLPGTRAPAPPADQDFWVVESEGTGERFVSWRLQSGTYQVVVMNADGSAGVDVSGSVGVKIRWIFPVAIALIVVGVLLLAGGVLLVVFGSKRRPVSTAGGTGPPIAYDPYPGAPAGATPVPSAPPGSALPPPGGGLRPGDPLPPPPPPGG